jgi:hypothetical protein
MVLSSKLLINAGFIMVAILSSLELLLTVKTKLEFLKLVYVLRRLDLRFFGRISADSLERSLIGNVCGCRELNIFLQSPFHSCLLGIEIVLNLRLIIFLFPSKSATREKQALFFCLLLLHYILLAISLTDNFRSLLRKTLLGWLSVYELLILRQIWSELTGYLLHGLLVEHHG